MTWRNCSDLHLPPDCPAWILFGGQRNSSGVCVVFSLWIIEDRMRKCKGGFRLRTLTLFTERREKCVCWRNTLAQIPHITESVCWDKSRCWRHQHTDSWTSGGATVRCVQALLGYLMNGWADAGGWIIKDYSWTFCPRTHDEEEEGAPRSPTPPPPVRVCPVLVRTCRSDSCLTC